MTTESVFFNTSDNYRLEGRLATQPTVRGAAVLCHPHPLFAGSMSLRLIVEIQRALGTVGWAALRFNFRGVGRSEGAYDGGIGEALDVVAALDRVSLPLLPLAVIGWSFGALVGLGTALTDSRVRTFVAVAPPLSVGTAVDLPPPPSPGALAAWRGRALAVCGSDDPYCTPSDLRAWASGIRGMEAVVLPGHGHDFSGARAQLAGTVASFVGEA